MVIIQIAFTKHPPPLQVRRCLSENWVLHNIMRFTASSCSQPNWGYTLFQTHPVSFCWPYIHMAHYITISPLSAHIFPSLLKSHRFPSPWLNAIHRTNPCIGTISFGLGSIYNISINMIYLLL